MSLNSLAGDSLTLPVGLATSEQGDKQHQNCLWNQDQWNDQAGNTGI